jgi:hypothetical protein
MNIWGLGHHILADFYGCKNIDDSSLTPSLRDDRLVKQMRKGATIAGKIMFLGIRV